MNSAFLTTTQDDLVDAELSDITYTIASKYAKNAHKAKLQKQSNANVHDQQILKSKAGKLPVGYYYVECIVRHRGTPPNVEYEVKWEGYDDKHNEWLKVKDITPANEGIQGNFAMKAFTIYSTDSNDNQNDSSGSN